MIKAKTLYVNKNEEIASSANIVLFPIFTA